LFTVAKPVKITAAQTSSWTFGTDGALALAGDLNFTYGGAIFEGGHGLSGRGWRTGLNIVGSNTNSTDPIRIYPAGGDGKGLGMGGINVKSDRVEIYGNLQNDSVGTFWTFNHDGSLTFPHGAGFGYGESGQLKVNDGVTLSLDFRDTSGRGFYTNGDGFSLRGDGDSTWTFGINGNLTLPAGGVIKNSDGSTYGGTTYTLPAATSSVLGGVKVGANISVTMDGTISVAAPFSGSYTDLTNKPTIGALSALNYVQVLGNTASPPSVSAGGTILSLTITTTGGPVELVGSGDANNASAAFYGTVQWYRGATALGNQQFFESSSSNENQSVTQVFIDNPTAGTYTYYWKMPRSSATITWGEGTTAPVISAKELQGIQGIQGIQGPTGPGMSYASGFVNAGTFVTLDNIKATVTTSGQRGLSLATVSGTATCYISGTYGMYGGATVGGASAGFSMTTTPSASIFSWSFGSEGDAATYILNYGYTKSYRITVMIGGAYNNNMISIERLI
jgi:hypothetical protein